MTILSRLRRRLRRFLRGESGSMTLHGLFTFAACCGIGAVGLDVTHFYAARTQLQVAADLAAHAALFQRHSGRTAAQARSDAIAAVQYGMPRSGYGDVIAPEDIVFGHYNAATRVFTPIRTSSTDMPSAVQVDTSRAGDNPVASFLFRIVGVDEMDVRADAIYRVYYPACLSEGFMAEGIIDIQSNNSFLRGFCLHAKKGVSLNNGNYFEDGTVVSMPSLSQLDISGSGFEQNLGLQKALREADYNMSELNRLRPGATLAPGVLPYTTAISTTGHSSSPWYLTSNTQIPMAAGSYAPASFTQGRVHYVECTSSSGRLTLTGGTYSQVVIMTNCEVFMSGQVNLEDVILYTSNTSDRSISASSGGSDGLVIGRNDNCAERGGATLLTLGGMKAAAKMLMYGGQIRLLGDFQFASGGNSAVTGQGVSVMAAGDIDGTTQMTLSGCGNGTMDRKFEAKFFSLAM